MDGFYFAFVAVGFGLFWQSSRQKQSSTVLMTAWIALGASLISAVVVLGGTSDPHNTGQVLAVHAVFEALRHILLGVTVICLGYSFAPADTMATRRSAESDTERYAEDLRNFVAPLPPDEE